jgi:hypothetical protein
MPETLEWWPDYGTGPLFLRDGPGGEHVPLESLDLSPDLSERLATWTADYREDKLPIDGAGDPVWIETGRELLGQARVELEGRFLIVVTEPWWGEPVTE